MPNIREAYVHAEIIDVKTNMVLYNIGEVVYVKKKEIDGILVKNQLTIIFHFIHQMVII